MRAYDLEVTGSLITTGSLKVVGDITAEQYQIKTTVTQVTMSAASGSMIFGDSIDDTHQITGSTTTSGSINVRNGELQVGGTIVPTGTAVSSSFAQKSAVSGSFINNTASSSFVSAASVSGSFVQGASVSGSLGLVAGVDTGTTAISGSAISTGSFGDVALRKGGKVKFSDASYIALSGSSISAPGEGIDMVANNLLALNIDETGAVTKPLQPAFSVSKTSLADSLTSTDSIFENGITEHFDNNGDFTSGVFTAPVTGKYHFTCRSIWESVSEGTSIDIILYGSNRNFWCSNRSMYHDDATGHGGYWSIGGSCVLDMDANDTADMQISGAGTCHNNGEIFYMQGYLLG